MVFRPRPILAALMASAGIVWIATLFYLFRFEGVPTKTFFSAGFFIAFFAISLAYYARTAIEVDQSGVTYRGIVRTHRFSFADILKVTVYLTDVNDRTKINPVRQEYFGNARPASTLIGINELAIPGMKVEIEAVVGLPGR